MANNEELNRNDIVELSGEALEQAAGGAGKTGKRLLVTRDAKIYADPRRYDLCRGYARKGKVFNEFTDSSAVDEKGAKFYIILWNGTASYISSRCVEII